MVNTSYFSVYDVPKHQKINKKRRHQNERDPKDKGGDYRINYGL